MADWDERYRRGEHATEEPHRLLARAVEHLRPGRALDVASGAGRHALFLAARGWQVVAMDSSAVGVELTRERARRRGVEVEAHVANLERGGFRVEPDAYDLVCVFYYLQRDLFPHLRAGLRPGGTFVAAIHTDAGSPGAKPTNPAFLLRPGELRAEFDAWRILHYREAGARDPNPGEHHRPTAEIIAVKM